jgi:hypothetical protein
METDTSNPKLDLIDENKVTGNIVYGGIPYYRTIELNSQEITITDKYNSELVKEININLFPDINIDIVENNVYKLWNQKNAIFLEVAEATVRIEKYNFSPQYGVKLQSNKIVLTSTKSIIVHKYRVSIES